MSLAGSWKIGVDTWKHLHLLKISLGQVLSKRLDRIRMFPGTCSYDHGGFINELNEKEEKIMGVSAMDAEWPIMIKYTSAR